MGDAALAGDDLAALVRSAFPRIEGDRALAILADVPGAKNLWIKTVKVQPREYSQTFVIEFENGFKVYHMGDTGLFGDLALIGSYYRPDLVLIPVGGHFVLSPHDAAHATRYLLKPRVAIPMHYGTNPNLRGTPEEYIAALGRSRTQVINMKFGEEVQF